MRDRRFPKGSVRSWSVFVLNVIARPPLLSQGFVVKKVRLKCFLQRGFLQENHRFFLSLSRLI